MPVHLGRKNHSCMHPKTSPTRRRTSVRSSCVAKLPSHHRRSTFYNWLLIDDVTKCDYVYVAENLKFAVHHKIFEERLDFVKILLIKILWLHDFLNFFWSIKFKYVIPRYTKYKVFIKFCKKLIINSLRLYFWNLREKLIKFMTNWGYQIRTRSGVYYEHKSDNWVRMLINIS